MDKKRLSKILHIFGRNLRTCRQRRRLSQKKLGSLAGLHRNTISMYERGVLQARLDSIEKVARAMRIMAEELLQGM